MLYLLSNDCLNRSPGLFWPTENPVSTKESAGQIFSIFTGTQYTYIRVKHTLPLVKLKSLTLSYWYASSSQSKIYNLIHPWPFSKLAELRLRVKLTIMPENECWKWEQVSAPLTLSLLLFASPPLPCWEDVWHRNESWNCFEGTCSQ